MEGLDPLAHGKGRRRSATVDILWLDMDKILDGVTGIGWKYLYDDLIAACYKTPP